MNHEPSSTLPFLPFALPEIGEEEIAEVVDTLRSGWVTTGPKAKRFEDDFTAFMKSLPLPLGEGWGEGEGALHSMAVNSATAGLHLALDALGIASVQHLQGHPIAGASWEGFVVEQVAAALPPEAQLSFYRTAAGAELDLVIEHGTRKLGVEIKFSSAPKPTKGFWQALQDLQIDRAFVIGPVPRRYPLAEGVEVLPLSEVTATLAAALRT